MLNHFAVQVFGCGHGGVGKFLVDTLTGTANNPAQAEQALRSLGYTRFEEQVFADRKLGIQQSDFDREVQVLANAYHFPDHVRKIFQRGKHAGSSAAYVKEFRFHLGQGNMFCGAVATMRNQNTIDMAYSFYQLDFHLTAQRIEHVHRETETILGFIPIGTETTVRVEYRARYLSEDAFEAYEAYFRSKAANGYRNKFIGHDEL